MNNEKHLKVMFEKELKIRGESVNDLIFISHPLELLSEISTLEEIRCFCLNGAFGWHIAEPQHKQDMPFIAITREYIYYYGDALIGDKLESFERDDNKGLHAKWSDEYKAWLDNMGKMRMLRWEILNKAEKRPDSDAQLQWFSCFVKHPDTEQQVKVEVTIQRFETDDEFTDDVIEVLDENGVDLLTLYTDADKPAY